MQCIKRIRVTMDKIDLLRKINQDLKEGGTKKVDPTALVKYQNYDLKIDEDEYKISVPLREAERFEATISETVVTSKRQLKEILRQFRGFIQI